MDDRVVSRLIDLNHQFYQTFAVQFAATRQRLQPGVNGLLPRLLKAPSLLDIGCGSGELARRLAMGGYSGSYTGLDFSSGLLEHARQGFSEQKPGDRQFTFLQADLSQPGWEETIGSWQAAAVAGFAVLHHLPGKVLRQRILKALWRKLLPGGKCYLSVWQFSHSRKLSARVLPWEEIGLGEEQVDPGDALLDWRAGGRGLRYVHEFSEDELAGLAGASGFKVEESYLADGREGNLALYQVWAKG